MISPTNHPDDVLSFEREREKNVFKTSLLFLLLIESPGGLPMQHPAQIPSLREHERNWEQRISRRRRQYETIEEKEPHWSGSENHYDTQETNLTLMRALDWASLSHHRCVSGIKNRRIIPCCHNGSSGRWHRMQYCVRLSSLTFRKKREVGVRAGTTLSEEENAENVLTTQVVSCRENIRAASACRTACVKARSRLYEEENPNGSEVLRS